MRRKNDRLQLIALVILLLLQLFNYGTPLPGLLPSIVSIVAK